MQQIVSITSQGQLTIPKSFLQDLGITSGIKAVVEKRGKTIVVSPKKDFWQLAGSLQSAIKLSDDELKKARDSFSKYWTSK